MRKKYRLHVASTLLVVSALVSCKPGSSPQSDATQLPPEVQTVAYAFGDSTAPGYESAIPGYVPDQVCAECHPDLYESYQEVGMAKSFYPPRPENRIEDFTDNHFFHEASDRHYEMVLRGDDMYQIRYQLDDSGVRFNELEMKVDAVIGSGLNVRTYVYRSESGELFQMPLAWYVKTREWGMNPGYDLPKHEGFTRALTRNCMFCHNAYPEVPKGSDQHGRPSIFPAEMPEGVGCQRCHGPGESHVEVARRDESKLIDLRDSIVNPARLDPARRDDVCFQCHLQPSSRFSSQILRFGRTEYSYRPGDPLDSFYLLIDFDDPEGADRFEINHQPYRLRQSRCYQESDGALNCLTCHDPHRKVAPEERLTHYRRACIQCHQVEQCEPAMQKEIDGLADCVACHMPKRRTEDVIQAVLVDHRIVMRPAPEAERLATKSEAMPTMRTTPPRPYLSETDTSDPELELHLAVAGISSGHPDQIRHLESLIERTQSGELEPLSVLAKMYLDRQDFPAAVRTLQRLVDLHPDYGRAHTELGLALDAVNQPQLAIEHLDRAIELGQGMPETYMGLGGAYYKLGDYDGAIRHLEEAVRLRPIYPSALLNLGIVLQVVDRWGESVDILEQSLAAEPNQSLAYWRLGLANYTLKNVEGALITWSRGAEVDATNPRICEGRALTLLQLGRLNEALQAAQFGYQINADEPSLLLIAAIVQFRQGNVGVATKAYQAAMLANQQSPSKQFVRDILLQQAASLFGRS